MKTVLVIEDDELIRDGILNILSSRGINAIAAVDGRSGLQLARDIIPDLILCDIRMPELNGYEVLSALRQDSRTAQIRLIFLTAENPLDLINLGANGYITKPFTTAQLLSAIAPYLF